jgi:hypothetical protein
MTPRKRSRLGATVATAAIGLLVVAGSALGIAPPTGVTSSPSGPSNATTWTFEWNAVAPDEGYVIVGYEGGVTAPGGEPAAPITSPHTVDLPPEDARLFRVRAVQAPVVDPPPAEPVLRSDYADVAIFPDRTPPALSLSLQPGAPNGLNGWYTSLTIQRVCDALGGSAVVGECGALSWTIDRGPAPYSHSVVDQAGNPSGIVSTPEFKFDRTRPRADAGQPTTPGPGALVASEPAFSWTPGADATSGVDRYELQYRAPGMDEYVTMARRDDTGGVGDYSAPRDPGLVSEPLPERVIVRWRVVTYDNAGNARASDAREITIDSTIPPAPTITGGPAAPTRISSPTFSWTGTEDTYLWDLTAAGSETPLRRGGGAATQTTITNLPDGDYTFRVSQVTKAGRPSAEATRSFKVDTTAPAAPGILVRPPFPAIAAPVFTWGIEPGAYSRWTVVGEGGATVIPSTDTPATSVTLPLLPDGAYSFQVQQVDPAGNVSAATAEPFTMLAPLVPAPSPSTGTAAITRLLPRQNALRLKPKAGRVLPTRSPVLQWKRGPRGTRLYNVQIFRVTSRRGATTPRITKVASLFPRTLQMRAPKRNLRAGTCYVWRVWPYTGRAFTPKPVGVSNFCVANAKVLKAKARAARAKRIARAKRLALARKAPIRR